VFFVISGFLINQLLVGEPQALTVIAAVVVAAWLLLSPLEADVVAHDVVVAGAYAARLRTLAGRVAVLTDVPRPPKDIPSCVSGAMRRLRRCAFARGPALANAFAIRAAAARVPGIETVDATDRFCLPDLCPAVVGDVLVYRNSGHVTASYMKTLAPWLERRLHRTTREAEEG
jgi:hypothetical protein